jgi:hypothetical protein
MSRPRAKKKQRRRARAARPAVPRPAAAPAPQDRAQEPALQDRAQEPAPRHPSRLDVRGGIARPDAVWAPFPLTEIGMAVGLVLFGVGFASGGSGGAWLLVIAVVLLSIVVGELCLREHFGGFRSHSVLLGLLPVTALHMVVVLVVTSDWRGPAVLAVDLALAGALAWWLRGRFAVAQDRARRRAAA